MAELDYSKMRINPKSPKLVKWMDDNIPQLKQIEIEEVKGFTRAMVYRYTILMYDPGSPIQEMHSLDWWNKKYHACKYAGFELKKANDGYERFDKRVDEFVLGKNDPVNDVIMCFIAWVNNHKWKHMVYLHESHMHYVRSGLGGKNTDVKSTKEARAIWGEINEVANDLGRVYEETEEFVSRFYYHIEQSRLAIMAEDYAKKLMEGDTLRGDNPYTTKYSVDKIKFVGDKIPEDEV